MREDDRLLSIEEVTERLGVSRSTLDRMTRAGKLPPVRMGSRVLFRETAVRALMEEPRESSAERYTRLRARLMDLLEQAERDTEDAERIRSKLALKGGEPAFRRLRERLLKGKNAALEEAKNEIESVENELAELVQCDASLPPLFGRDTIQLTELRGDLRAVLDDADRLTRVMKRPAGLGPAEEMRQEKLGELTAEAERLTKLIRKFESKTWEGPADPDA